MGCVGGTRLYNPWPHSACTIRTRYDRDRRTLGALKTRSERPHSLHVRWTCARALCALCMRYVCARPQPTNTQRIPRPIVCPACVWRWSSAPCVGLCVAFFSVHSCVVLRAHVCACTTMPTQTANSYFSSARAVRRACVTGALDGCYTFSGKCCEGSPCTFFS